MPELIFYGVLDNLLGKCNGAEELWTVGDWDRATVLVTHPEVEGGLLVVAEQAAQGAGAGWSIGVAAYNDADGGGGFASLPPWPITIEPGASGEHSPVLRVQVPEGFEIEQLEEE